MSSHTTMKPTGGVGVRRVIEPPDPNDRLLEQILSRPNMQQAWKRVKANRGAAGVDAAVAVVRRADSFGVNRIYVPHHKELNESFLAGLKRIPPEWELTCCTRMICGEPLKQNLKLEYAGYSAATG